MSDATDGIQKTHLFNRPGNYRIHVQGILDKKWFERLGGFRIITSKTEDQESVTWLEGRISDQAELAGVLSTLYQRHLVILLVEHLYEN